MRVKVIDMLSEEEQQEIDAEAVLYERRQAACIEALRIVQRHRGWVSDDALKDIAAALEMSATELDGIATFYNLVYRRPVGRHVIHLCDSVSCWIVGYDRLRDHLKSKLNVDLGGTTDDSRFTLLTVPCLGTCDHAPAMLIDDDLHRDLDPDRLAEIVDPILERYE